MAEFKHLINQWAGVELIWWNVLNGGNSPHQSINQARHLIQSTHLSFINWIYVAWFLWFAALLIKKDMWTVLSWSTEPSTKSVVPTIDIRSAISLLQN